MDQPIVDKQTRPPTLIAIPRRIWIAIGIFALSIIAPLYFFRNRPANEFNGLNGLILIGHQKDLKAIQQYVRTPWFNYNYEKWKANDNQKQLLNNFKRQVEAFRIVLVINQNKLQEARALYIREIFKELQFFRGIEDYLSYIDILVIERTFKQNVRKLLQNFAKAKENHLFQKTPHLIVNLLFNIKNNSIVEQAFMREVVEKQGLKSSYLGIKHGRIDIAKEIKREAKQTIRQLARMIEQHKIRSPTLVSLYYSACNNQKQRLVEILQTLLGRKVVIHLSNLRTEQKYKEAIKKQVSLLRNNIELFENCSAPHFRTEACQRQFYMRQMEEVRAKEDH